MKDYSEFLPVYLEAIQNEYEEDDFHYRLVFGDWEWLSEIHDLDCLQFELNGFGIQGLLKAHHHKIGLAYESDIMWYSSEGDFCVIYFVNEDEAIETAESMKAFLSDQVAFAEIVDHASIHGFHK